MSLMSTLAKREDMFLETEFTKEDIKYLKHINEVIENVLEKNKERKSYDNN